MARSCLAELAEHLLALVACHPNLLVLCLVLIIALLLKCADITNTRGGDKAELTAQRLEFSEKLEIMETKVRWLSSLTAAC